MTNEVEKLILLTNNKDSNIKDTQNVAYKFYKEIWKFLFYANEFDYKDVNIVININRVGDSYIISPKDGITFKIIGNDFKYCFVNFYDGCNFQDIKSLMGANIDIRILYKLLNSDGFSYDYFCEDNFNLYININKYDVDRVIDNVLMKNKILKKEL